MPKYYVEAGEYQMTVDRPTEVEAALEALTNAMNQKIPSVGLLTHVSEVGPGYHEEDWYLNTCELLDLIGAGYNVRKE